MIRRRVRHNALSIADSSPEDKINKHKSGSKKGTGIDIAPIFIYNSLMKPRILVVEDNRSMREMLCCILTESGFDPKEAPDVSTALLLFQKEHFSLILSDLQLPDMDVICFLKKIHLSDIPFIILTAFGSIQKAVEAIKEGAYDFITKPVDPDYLILMVKKAIESTQLWKENIVLREVISAELGQPVIIGQSRCLLSAAEKVKQVASTDTSVLIQGESGTGKELFARVIHQLSPRRNKPFIAVNSASIPENLLENELFGHEKGSFTGAYGRQIGKLEMAAGGTFFFDEIGDFPQSLQGKILRFLEDKTITRIGTSQQIELDIRYIFASNQDLEQAVKENRFRRDLYFRITAFPIQLPPLREREDDIEVLADYFYRKFAREMKKDISGLSEKARIKLRSYPWPGNVRELQNTLERAVILCRDSTLDDKDIVLPEQPFFISDQISFQGTLPEVISRAQQMIERRKIETVLKETHFLRTKAAKILGISYKTLLEKIKQYGIRP